MHGRLATVRALLDGGVDVNATPYCRQRALHYAAYIGRAEVVEELMARCADASVVDFLDLSAIESELSGLDACFFCLGVSSVGMQEDDYRRVTYDFTMTAARTLARLNPGMTFVYVSGTSTDSSERGRTMWARVKGQTENALLALPFKAATCSVPG